jgi:Uma2 family endonuclease
MCDQLPAAMTATEFLDWNPQDSDRWELTDGTPQAMAPTSPRHGAMQSEAGRLIGNHLAEARLACRVNTEPGVRPRVRASFNVRVPDLAVTCAEWNPHDRLLNEPLVVVEILSPSNKADTWANVWSYVTIPSVRELLVLHTADVRADLLRREADSTWPDNPVSLAQADAVTLQSIGSTAPLAAFYRRHDCATGHIAVRQPSHPALRNPSRKCAYCSGRWNQGGLPRTYSSKADGESAMARSRTSRASSTRPS